uniref:Cytochrome P450 n=1 Tax=Heligmosomoides polygyrus TaxID=6339 RepID=A0A183F5Y1_HELPZ
LPAYPESSAVVSQNGTLIINPFRATDVGEYFSPDEMERRLMNLAPGENWKWVRGFSPSVAVEFVAQRASIYIVKCDFLPTDLQ